MEAHLDIQSLFVFWTALVGQDCHHRRHLVYLGLNYRQTDCCARFVEDGGDGGAHPTGNILRAAYY
jgi:hypothetical protein